LIFINLKFWRKLAGENFFPELSFFPQILLIEYRPVNKPLSLWLRLSWMELNGTETC
ncbi:hypothetical protein ACJX0J_015296, partial [Zea mays]